MVYRHVMHDGITWVIRRTAEGPVVSRHLTADDATSVARAELAGRASGGVLIEYGPLGQPVRTTEVSSTLSRLSTDVGVAGVGAADATKGPVRSALDTTRRQGKIIDSVGQRMVSLLGVLGVGVMSAETNSEITAAADGGWVQVFVATIGWSLAVALFAVAYFAGHTSPPRIWMAGVASMIVSSLVAGALGQRVVEPADLEGGDPRWMPLVNFVVGAANTYGPVGFLLGTGIGVWLGYTWTPVIARLTGGVD